MGNLYFRVMGYKRLMLSTKRTPLNQINIKGSIVVIFIALWGCLY